VSDKHQPASGENYIFHQQKKNELSSLICIFLLSVAGTDLFERYCDVLL
jgi:hypothetical protein